MLQKRVFVTILALLGAMSVSWDNARRPKEMHVAATRVTPLIPLPTASAAAVRTAPCAPTTHSVRKGESLWRIAANELGNPELWPTIWEENRAKIKDPKLIYPGQTFLVPCAGNLIPVAARPARHAEQKTAQAVFSPREGKTTVAVTSSAPVSSPAPKAVAAMPPLLKAAIPDDTPMVLPTSPAAQDRAPQATPEPVPPPSNAETKKEESKPQAPIVASPFTTMIGVPRTLPGSFWNAALTTPVEKGNFVNYTHFDQGFVLLQNGNTQVQPFVSLDHVVDRKRYPWNNKTSFGAGVRLAQSFRRGVVVASGAMVHEQRENGVRALEPVLSGSWWFGWEQPTVQPARGGLFDAFPGTTWGIVGNISPLEKKNVISSFYLEQGVSLAKISNAAFVLFGEGALGVDSQGHDWNNRYLYGGGLKLAVPSRVGVAEVRGGYSCERRWITNATACGPGARVNIWVGWKPPARR